MVLKYITNPIMRVVLILSIDENGGTPIALSIKKMMTHISGRRISGKAICVNKWPLNKDLLPFMVSILPANKP